MDQRLLALAHSQGNVFTTADAVSVGLTGNGLTHLLRSGEVVRFRRDAYCLATAYESAGIAERYRLRVLAVLHSRPRTDRASHHSALALLGLPSFGVPLDLVLAEGPSGGQRRANGLLLHRPSSGPGLRIRDLRLVSASVACVQVADRYGFVAGVCAMDGALHARRCTLAELEGAVAQVSPRRRRRVHLALAAADATTESIGESRTRIILRDAGFVVVPQFVVEHRGRFVARVDFLVDDCVVVEFDGLVKYEGLDGSRALAAEKKRESELSHLGYEVVRVVWSDLSHPMGIVHRVQDAKRLALRRRAALAG